MNVKFTSLLTAFSFFILSMNAQEKPQDKIQTAKKFSKKVTKNIGCEYLISFPKNYDKKSTNDFPLMLFLHGAGERGSDIWRASIHGPSKYAVAHPDFPFILVTPQCPTNETWSNDILLALLDKIVAENNVDTNRIYLTGLSMGGYGTWSLGISHCERFAAIAPICGGGERIRVLLGARGFDGAKRAEILKHLPVWAFHGAKDPVVPLEESERMVKALKDAGNTDAKLTIYPETQHDSWTETYNNPGLYEWFLQHERK